MTTMYHLLLGTLKTSHNGTVPERSIMIKQHFAAYCLKQPSGVKCCLGRHLSSETELISNLMHPPRTWGFFVTGKEKFEALRAEVGMHQNENSWPKPNKMKQIPNTVFRIFSPMKTYFAIFYTIA